MFILHTNDCITFFNQYYIFILPLKFKLDMNSPKTYEIMELGQKYEINEYLSFNVFYI